MARLPFPEDVDPDLVESQRPDSLPEKYSHLNQQAARNVYRSISHHPEVVETMRDYIGATWSHCGLTDRERELLILAVAVEIDSEYEWHQHVRIALLEGLTPEEILAISNNDFGRFDEKERAIMAFSQASTADKATDEDVEQLREYFNAADISAITALIGAYVALNVVLATLDVETEEPFVGWQLEDLERDE